MRRLLAWMWPMFRQRWRTLLPACALALVTAAATVGLLGVSGWFLTATALVSGALATFNLFVPSAMVRGLAFVRILSRYGERVSGHAATLVLLTDLRTRVFGNLLRLDAGQLARWRDGDLVARLTGDIDALDSTFLLSLLPLLVGGIAGAVVIAVLAVYVPPAAAAVGLLWLCVLLLAPAWLARRARRSGAERQAHAADLRQHVLQAVEGHADLLALGAAGRAEAALADSSDRLRAAALSESRAFASGQALALACAGLAMLAVATAGAAALREGRVGGAVLVGCVLAVAGLFEVVAPVLRGAVRLGAASAAAERVREIERAGPEILDPPRPKALPMRGAVEFRQVYFRHHPSLPLLEGVDLRIAPGERVVVTGASGSGKSTLLALLLRLRDPQAGGICWEGVDLREASLPELHRRVALLPQDAPVFLGTVRDNLRIGDPDADDAGLWEALRQAGLDEEIRALPGGLDQWLGEGGRTLSAGQARRLCLARVLLTGAPLVALDEPTEGLDPDAEQAFFRDLPRILHGRSLLLVTHALVPSGIADATWELVDGRLKKKPVRDTP
ncbi:thiol reductant ABC exporter subunit CydC [Stenotrophomonas sp. JC08]|uniref:thiol reductant ABC exporter subunit CydC n=1 Tax=Stenotrophomonas sp. JC08 TaxID=3445779 RepID=UPI003FA24AC5